MTYQSNPVLTALPSDPGWVFGDFPYGLEPLTLPYPGVPDLPDSRPSVPAFADCCRRIQLVADCGPWPGEVEPCQQEDRLYWFRWIVGHQVSFIIWRLTAELVESVGTGSRPSRNVLMSLCHYVDGYSAMLLYTGSCSQGCYQRLIRPSMWSRHPSFSGSWAPDFSRVRNLLRWRRLPFADSPGSAELYAAISRANLVHECIAAKLVPDGRSLLHQSPVRRQHVQLLNLIYDNYFMTLRAPVSKQDVVAQLLRRLIAVTQDIAANGIHLHLPVEAGRPGNGLEPPREPVTKAIQSERDLSRIIVRVAYDAAGIARESPGLLVPGEASALATANVAGGMAVDEGGA